MNITDAQRLAWLLLPDSYVGIEVKPPYHNSPVGAKWGRTYYAARRNDTSFHAYTKLEAIDFAVEHSIKTDPAFRIAHG